MEDKVIHPTIGEIIISRSRRARRISLTVRPSGMVRLTLPPSVSIKEGLRFVETKQEWARKALEKYAAAYPPEPVSMPFSTREHYLTLSPVETDRIRSYRRNGQIVVEYPLEKNYTDTDVQSAIKKAVEEAWRAEAKAYLPGRLQEISQATGLRYRSVAVRNTVSKWGSCSHRDDISLSLHLMRLPDHLIDYILLHELCHTVHKNHSARFHQLVDSFAAGREKELRKELKKYHTRW